MPDQTSAVNSTFCWIELQTKDLAAARTFYEGLFGWKTSDMPGAIPYAIANNKDSDKQVAGMGPLTDVAKKLGSPPYWLAYVGVDDAAASGKKIVQAGGKVLLGPLEMGPGNMVVAQDPGGAVYALWQQLQSMGTFQWGEVGSMGWNELLSSNVDRDGKFYSTVFGWKLDPGNNPAMPYTVFKQGDQMIAGMMAITKELEGAPQSWWVYFSVDDCDATLAKAKQLGGKIKRPGTEIPDVGRFGIIEDPQGAVFAVIKFLPMPK